MTVAKREAILFLFGCSEVNSTWLITSELANQHARKALFTCVVYTNGSYTMAVEPIKSLEIAFKMIQFLIKCYLSVKKYFEQKMEILSNFWNYYYNRSNSLKSQPSPTAKPRPLWVRGRRRLTFLTIHGLLFPGLETLSVNGNRIILVVWLTCNLGNFRILAKFKCKECWGRNWRIQFV